VDSTGNKTTDHSIPQGWRIQDEGFSSVWRKRPTLLAGGAGLVSTAYDFLRYTQMLLNEGVLENTRVMAVDTARLAVGNINPPGIMDPSEGAGAGTRALLGTRLLRRVLWAAVVPPGRFSGLIKNVEAPWSLWRR